MADKKDGRFWIPDWVVDYDVLRDLSLGETRVLFILARFANKSGVAWPAVSRMAEMSGLSTRSVQRALRSLAVNKGLIAKITKGSGGRHISTKYRMFFQSWLLYKPDQESVADDILAPGILPEDQSDKGRHSPVMVSDKGRHSPVGVSQDADPEKGRHPATKRVTDGGQKGDTAVSYEGSEKELEKESALSKISRNIGKKVEATATANNEAQTRAEANRQKQELMAIQQATAV